MVLDQEMHLSLGVLYWQEDGAREEKYFLPN